MVKRGANGDVGGHWQKSHGLSVGSEVPRLFARVRRAASRLPIQSEEPVMASSAPPKTATLTMPRRVFTSQT